MMRILVLALALVSGAPASAGTVKELVFDARLLAGMSEPQTLRYRYELRGSLLPEVHRSQVRMEVREVSADGGKLVHFDMLEEPDRRQFGPMHARAQNPLIIVFLQRDVMQMARLTGGSRAYFRNRIREAFVKPAEVERLEIRFHDATLPAVRVSITPFLNDPQIARFAQFRHKRYEFTVAEGLPGGLHEIAVLTPKSEGGEVLLAERVTFAGRASNGAQNR